MLHSVRDYARYSWQMLNGFRANSEVEIADRRRRDIEPYIDTSKPLRILDLANGRLRPQYTLLTSEGHHVYGIDQVNRRGTSKTDQAYQIARRMYTWRLGLQTPAARTLVCGDVGILPFLDNSFDVVTSVAAFEHFLDVPSVVAELQRVLRPGGIAWIGIHLFSTLSGGHNLSFTEFPPRTIPLGVEPWDHLRKRQLPFTVPLNEWRKDQYLEAFGRHFEILAHYAAGQEGTDFLTSEIEAELAEYSREELTCGAYMIVARKHVDTTAVLA
jgi:SAM-dependent methyltransferase